MLLALGVLVEILELPVLTRLSIRKGMTPSTVGLIAPLNKSQCQQLLNNYKTL